MALEASRELQNTLLICSGGSQRTLRHFKKQNFCFFWEKLSKNMFLTFFGNYKITKSQNIKKIKGQKIKRSKDQRSKDQKIKDQKIKRSKD